SIGIMANNVTEAISNLEVSHYDLRFIKPLDENLLHYIFTTYNYIITVEDGTVKGGFGTAILEFAAEQNYRIPIKVLGVPDEFIEHGSIRELQRLTKTDAQSIRKAIEYGLFVVIENN